MILNGRTSAFGRAAILSAALVLAAAAPMSAAHAQNNENPSEEAIIEASSAVSAAPIIGVRADASSWRLIDGEGISGVMGLGPFLNLGEPDPIRDTGPSDPARVGYFILYVEGRGVFEGVYNLKEGGSAVVGAFWPDGKIETDVVAGFLDIRGLDAPETVGGAGSVTFTDDGAQISVSAR